MMAEPRAVNLYRLLVPTLQLALAVVLAALPWGLAADARFVLPLLPLLVVHYWARRRTAYMTAIHAFLAGLALDVLTHGPLGYWSLIYLAGHGLSQWDGLADEDNVLVSWVHFALVISATAGLAWALSSAYFLAILDWRPLAYAAGIAIALYPLPAYLAASAGSGRERRQPAAGA